MIIDVSKVYKLKKQQKSIEEYYWNLSKLNGTHPIIVIPKPKSLLTNKVKNERTYLAIVGTSVTYYKRDVNKYLFIKVLNKTTYFFSSELRTIKESEIEKGEYTEKSKLSEKEFVLCYNTVKDYYLDIDEMWIEEYCIIKQKQLANKVKEQKVTNEERDKRFEELRKQEPIRMVEKRLERSNFELREAMQKQTEKIDKLVEQNQEMVKQNLEMKNLNNELNEKILILLNKVVNV